MVRLLDLLKSNKCLSFSTVFISVLLILIKSICLSQNQKDLNTFYFQDVKKKSFSSMILNMMTISSQVSTNFEMINTAMVRGILCFMN